MFVILLTSIANTSKHTKCVLLSHQKCMTQPTFVNLYPNNEYILDNLLDYAFQIKQKI